MNPLPPACAKSKSKTEVDTLTVNAWLCDAKFLIGLKEAKVRNNDAPAGRYICFWCFDEREPDDPPSKFHYGSC
jgi:hypothetical protein